MEIIFFRILVVVATKNALPVRKANETSLEPEAAGGEPAIQVDAAVNKEKRQAWEEWLEQTRQLGDCLFGRLWALDSELDLK
jgi:hypothetical protein